MGGVPRNRALPAHGRAEELDSLLEVFADFADLKIPYALGHSRRVAELAAGAGRVLGMGTEQISGLRQAGLLHDLGRSGISSSIWEKPGPLSSGRLGASSAPPLLHRTDSSSLLAPGTSRECRRLPPRAVEWQRISPRPPSCRAERAGSGLGSCRRVRLPPRATSLSAGAQFSGYRPTTPGRGRGRRLGRKGWQRCGDGGRRGAFGRAPLA